MPATQHPSTGWQKLAVQLGGHIAWPNATCPDLRYMSDTDLPSDHNIGKRQHSTDPGRLSWAMPNEDCLLRISWVLQGKAVAACHCQALWAAAKRKSQEALAETDTAAPGLPTIGCAWQAQTTEHLQAGRTMGG